MLREEVVEKLAEKGEKHRIMEATLRYEWLDRVLSDAQITIDKKLEETNFSEKVDKILTHKWAGPAIFVVLLTFIFQAIFSWATVPMDWIDNGVGWVGQQILRALPTGMFRDLIVEGSLLV